MPKTTNKALSDFLLQLSTSRNLLRYIKDPDGYLDRFGKALTAAERKAIKSGDQAFIRRRLRGGWDRFCGIIHRGPGSVSRKK